MSLTDGYSILTEMLGQSKLSFIIANKYVYAVFILLASVILAKMLLFIVKKYVIKLASKTKTDIDDKLIHASHGPVYYILVLLGLHFALSVLQIEAKTVDVFSKIIFSVMAVIVTVLLVRVGKVIIDIWGSIWSRKTKVSIDTDLLPLLRKTLSAILIIAGLLFILKYWGVDITGFLAGVGIAGIAIGFAVKDSLANIFGGISLILDKNIKMGDKVKIESGEMGTIKDIGLRSTKLLTFDNELIIVPNGSLANTRIQNYVLPEPRQRIKVNFGVEYGSSPDKVRKVVIDAVKNLDHVLKDPAPEVDFLEMGDFALHMLCKVWVDSYKNAYAVKINATETIYKVLNKAKIGIPFPTRTIYTKKG